MEKMITLAEKKEINEDERSIVGWGSRAVIDRDHELIKGEGWDLKAFRKNPVLMLSHNYSTPPVGKVLWVKNSADGLKFKAQFAKTPTGDEVFELYKQDIMHAFSVGFIPKEWEDADEDTNKPNTPKRVYTKAELLEISCVSIPSCPDALIEAYNSGQIKTKELGQVINDMEVRAIGGSKTLPLDPDSSWDAAGAEARMRNAAGGPDKDKINWATYRKGFAWYDKSDAENYGAYKLPFADIKDGKLTAIWRGIAAAMAALLGARGGVDIPDSERKAVYDFLVSYYRRFEKEPPDFKEYTEEELKELMKEDKDKDVKETPEDNAVIYFGEKYAELKAELAELKEGRVLSSKNRKLVNNCITQMQEVITELQKLMDASEPDEGEKMTDEPKDIDLNGLDFEAWKKSKEFNPSEQEIKTAIQLAFEEAAKGLKPDLKSLVDERIKRAQGKIA